MKPTPTNYGRAVFREGYKACGMTMTIVRKIFGRMPANNEARNPMDFKTPGDRPLPGLPNILMPAGYGELSYSDHGVSKQQPQWYAKKMIVAK